MAVMSVDVQNPGNAWHAALSKIKLNENFVTQDIDCLH